MFRSRSWFGWNKPKSKLSLDHLKYLHSVLEKNQLVSEHNKGLLVESLRSIAEILIWGDQNDSSVFDFFLEKNMLCYFLNIMRQKSFVCVQLLQTLNILFENIRNETSLYYLLSNNHVNSIIVHKFDFSDEDVMGYYILFLKTLSLKLNTHTIHFFYNELTNDFPLYTEAIKFFNHPEGMVRIAVRNISLNVYRVHNESMLQFIRDRTAAPYFSNLVWFIGKHIIELDSCVKHDQDHQSQDKLSNLIAEHLDHLHYLHDILTLNISDLNAVLTEHLLNKLFVPLYIFSLTPAPPISMALVTKNLAEVLNKHVDIDVQELDNPRVSPVVGLFALSLVFLVMQHPPLVHALAWVILNGDHSIFKEGSNSLLSSYTAEKRDGVPLGFGRPQELEEALESTIASSSRTSSRDELESIAIDQAACEGLEKCNITDEEKEKLIRRSLGSDETSRPFLDMVLNSLDCSENDYLPLLSLCLIFALANNRGIDADWLEATLNQTVANSSSKYHTVLVEKLMQIIHLSSQPSCRIRLVTVELTIKVLMQRICSGKRNALITDTHRQLLVSAKDQSMTVLRNFYKSEDIFLDLFEDEYNEMQKAQMNVEFLCQEAAILLPPIGTPLTSIGFTLRLPCGQVEKARRAIRVFFLIRRLYQQFFGETETLLPLTNLNNCVKVEQTLDLNNSDLIACTVLTKDGTKYRRFLVIDVLQLILIEPDPKRLGWGVAKLVGFLQDVEVVGDKDDSRCLHLTVHRGGAMTNANRAPILSAKFIFDDHIRCMAAKQRLTKGRTKARQKKMYQIAQLLAIPGQMTESPVTTYATHAMRSAGTSRSSSRDHRPIFNTSNRIPGVAAALRRESMPGVSRVQITPNRTGDGESPSSSSSSRHRSSSNARQSAQTSREVSRSRNSPRSREGSPRMTIRPRSEEIPLEDFKRSQNSSPVPISSHNSSRPNTPNLRPEPFTVNGVIKEVPPNGITVTTPSEETSFMSQQRTPESKKPKGTIETV